jgi:CHAT domain-containing protein
MSLWKVSDQRTQELMVAMYEHLLDGSSPHEALRAAQLAVRKAYPDPWNWGAFICQGGLAPLWPHVARLAHVPSSGG